MALTNSGYRLCDREIKGRDGKYKTCSRRASRTIKGSSGASLDYCTKHIKAALKEYPQG